MLHPSALRSFRLDGLEAMLCAVAFIAVVTALSLLRVALRLPDVMEVFEGIAVLGLGSAVASVWGLRRFRPTRARAAGRGERVVTRRSLASLLLLGIGWFVLFIAAVFALVAAAIMSDPKFRATEVLFLPVVPLLLGGGLVYAGLRAARGRQLAPAPAANFNDGDDGAT